MKNTLLLKVVLSITIIVEAIIVILMIRKVGFDHSMHSIVRLMIQFFLVTLILSSQSKKSLFILVFYHIVIGLLFRDKYGTETIGIIFTIYHLAAGVLIYFHDYITESVKSKYNKNDKIIDSDL